MDGVKRIEAKGLISELKTFAFEGNQDFRNGLVRGLDITKTYHLPTSLEMDQDDEVYYPHKSVTLSLSAHRENGKIRNHPPYYFSLAATAARNIRVIPPHIFNELKPKKQRRLADIEADNLSEAHTTTFSTSSYEQGEIEVSHEYAMSYADKPFFYRSGHDLLMESSGEFIKVPDIETCDKSGYQYAAEVVEQEQLPSVADRLINHLAFQAIINPFELEDVSIYSFRDATERMRIIMDIMRKGIGIDQLHDL